MINTSCSFLWQKDSEIIPCRTLAVGLVKQDGEMHPHINIVGLKTYIAWGNATKSSVENFFKNTAYKKRLEFLK